MSDTTHDNVVALRPQTNGAPSDPPARKLRRIVRRRSCRVQWSIPARFTAAADAIKDSGRLTVCTTGDYPPFTEQAGGSGEFTGIDVDIARDLAQTLGVEVEWVKTSWKTLMDDYLAGCDIAVGGISMNPERAEQVFFTAPTLEDGKTPIARCEDVEKYRSVEDINKPGVISIFPEGGTNEKFAREHYPEGELKTHDNLTIFDEIVAGRADVMTTDRSEVLFGPAGDAAGATVLTMLSDDNFSPIQRTLLPVLLSVFADAAARLGAMSAERATLSRTVDRLALIVTVGDAMIGVGRYERTGRRTAEGPGSIPAVPVGLAAPQCAAADRGSATSHCQ